MYPTVASWPSIDNACLKLRNTAVKHLYTIVLTGCLVLLSQAVAAAQEQTQCTSQTRFVFSWPIDGSCHSKPRGGTSKGDRVTVDNQPHKGWQSLQQPGLSKKEQDRRAILAMAGGYTVNFDFLEVVGFSEDFNRDQPYQSWGTEYVYVIADEANFISLQHIMVMVFVDADGNASEPMVMKHWRQDWHYQAKQILTYRHNNQWQLEKIPANQRQGTWSQMVYQVDDSPRYASYGSWQHNNSFSTWLSQTTRRPLPRREHSVRDDYDILEGFNRHTITRTGWVQEEENWKLVLNENGKPAAEPYLSKELGIARYRTIVDFDFTPGDKYMASAGKFWADVRAAFSQIIDDNKGFTLKRPQDAPPLFVPLFEYAAKVAETGKYNGAEGKAFAQKTIKAYSGQ